MASQCLLLVLLMVLSTFWSGSCFKAQRITGFATSRSTVTTATTHVFQRATALCAKRPSDFEPRRIVGKDNLGEPIYEGDENNGETLNILGVKLPIDPLTGSLAVFALIAFQFFVVANL